MFRSPPITDPKNSLGGNKVFFYFLRVMPCIALFLWQMHGTQKGVLITRTFGDTLHYSDHIYPKLKLEATIPDMYELNISLPCSLVAYFLHVKYEKTSFLCRHS